MDSFSDRLRALRKRHHLSQDTLAQRVGTSQRQISYYEAGMNEPTVHVLVGLADVLGTTVDYLIGFTNSPDRSVHTLSDLAPDEKKATEILRRAHPDKRKEMLRVLEAMSQ